ncbi:MAG: hypothetical protein IID18_07975, partial [Nitrospinae bacterium]|nr:hypothetical protein [Nitrospinota bacterium]
MSVVGDSDPAAATGLLLTTLKKMDIPAQRAGEATAALFKIFEQGGASIKELSGDLGPLFEKAKGANIGLNEFGGAFISLREQGENAQPAIKTLEKLSDFIANPDEGILGSLGEVGKKLATAKESNFPILKTLSELKRLDADQLKIVFPDDKIRESIEKLNSQCSELPARILSVQNATASFDAAFEAKSNEVAVLFDRMQEGLIVGFERIGRGVSEIPGSTTDSQFQPDLGKTGADATDALIQGMQTRLISSRGEIGNFFSTNLSAVLDPAETEGGLNPSLWGGNVSTAYADGFLQNMPLITDAAGQVSAAWDEGLVAPSIRSAGKVNTVFARLDQSVSGSIKNMVRTGKFEMEDFSSFLTSSLDRISNQLLDSALGNFGFGGGGGSGLL